MGSLAMTFDFWPYDSHHEVHQRYFLALSSEEYVTNPHTVMSVDPQSNVVDVILGAVLTNYSIQKVSLKSWQATEATSD